MSEKLVAILPAPEKSSMACRMPCLRVPQTEKAHMRIVFEEEEARGKRPLFLFWAFGRYSKSCPPDRDQGPVQRVGRKTACRLSNITS